MSWCERCACAVAGPGSALPVFSLFLGPSVPLRPCTGPAVSGAGGWFLSSMPTRGKLHPGALMLGCVPCCFLRCFVPSVGRRLELGRHSSQPAMAPLGSRLPTNPSQSLLFLCAFLGASVWSRVSSGLSSLGRVLGSGVRSQRQVLLLLVPAPSAASLAWAWPSPDDHSPPLQRFVCAVRPRN